MRNRRRSRPNLARRSCTRLLGDTEGTARSLSESSCSSRRTHRSPSGTVENGGLVTAADPTRSDPVTGLPKRNPWGVTCRSPCFRICSKHGRVTPAAKQCLPRLPSSPQSEAVIRRRKRLRQAYGCLSIWLTTRGSTECPHAGQRQDVGLQCRWGLSASIA